MKHNKQQPEEQDRHLQSPGEANRDKHINFAALEQGDQDPADEDIKLHLTDNSTLQTREEKERDNAVDVRRDNTISVSEDTSAIPNAGRLTGRESDDERDINREEQ